MTFSLHFLSTSLPGTTIATALVAEGRCLPFTKTASFPALYVISWATKGPATWCLQMGREADNSHTRHSSTVLPACVTGRSPSFQRTWGSTTDCQLPTQAWQQFVTQLTQALLLSAFLFVKWAICCWSLGSSVKSAARAAHPGGQLGSESRGQSPSAWLAPFPSFWILQVLLSHGGTLGSPCVVFAATEKSTQKEGFWWDIWEVWANAVPFCTAAFFGKTCLLFCEMRPWAWGKEVAKICPSSHSRGETHRLAHQVIKTWWGNQKPQLTLIASTAATLSHHSFRTYVQQQHWGAGSQLCSQHRGEEVRSTAWRRLLWQVLQKFRDLPSPPFFLLMRSPPSPPRANYFVIRNSDKHTWRFQLPVFHVGWGGG